MPPGNALSVKMVIVYEELKAAKAAKAAIDALLTTTRKPVVLATLGRAKQLNIVQY
jgi:hypothetical protein